MFDLCGADSYPLANNNKRGADMGVRKPRVMVFNVNIEWIAEDKVYLATSDDIDGLILEAATINEMVENLP